MRRTGILIGVVVAIGCSKGPDKSREGDAGERSQTDAMASDASQQKVDGGPLDATITTDCAGCTAPGNCEDGFDPCSCLCEEGTTRAERVCRGGCWALPDDAGSTDAGSSDAGTDAGAPDTGTLRHRGTCTMVDGCTTGACVAIPDEPGGYHTCVTEPADPAACDDGGLGAQDECCRHVECTDQAEGRCITTPIFYCGGAFPQEQNRCMYDECVSDVDCMAQPGKVPTCLPAGAFNEPVARCSYGDCQLDADCGARAGGECTPFTDPCSSRFIGFFCTYDDSVCREDDDCPRSSSTFGSPYCAPGSEGVSECRDFVPPP